MTHDTRTLGKPTNRVDGRVKVTGAARYAAEHDAAGLLHGFVVSSTIAKGRIVRIDASAALALDGVLHVLTHENRPGLPWFDRSYKDDDSPAGSPLRYLYDDKVVHCGQPIALVVASTFELARYAASLVRVEYKVERHRTDLRKQRKRAYVPNMGKAGFEPPPKPRGNAERAFRKSAARLEAEYSSPVHHHNPMEMHASTVIYDADGSLTIHEKTQGVQNSQRYVRKVFGLEDAEVRVLSPYVGGAFGSGLRPQYQLYLAVMAARELKRSVRVSLTRQQMFTFGHRPETVQKVSLGATSYGRLQAVLHEAVAETSRFEDYVEVVVNWSGTLYRCDNVKLDYKVAQLDIYTPLDMRAPGAALGVYALECAMDELSYLVGVDPVALRLLNYADEDQNEKKPYSSKALRACYAQGAERFGWTKRSPAPRSMRDGRRLVGWGMATGVWDAMQVPAMARASLSIDGKLTVASATADIGTGTYTVMSQIAADRLGLRVEDVTFQLGDSSLPMSPLEGGSFTVSSVGTAVSAACEKVCDRLFKLARKAKGSPFVKASRGDVAFDGGRLRLVSDPGAALSLTEIMRSAGVLFIEERAATLPNLVKQTPFSRATHSAVFAEVKVDDELGTVAVTRVVSAVAAGKILNPKTARSQILGAVVWGIGMALQEETATDHRLGRYMNHNLAEYHMPVNADVRDIDVLFVEEEDSIVNPLGAKGIGEIGIVGVAAAVANAVFHATGRRVRDLPITLDKLL